MNHLSRLKQLKILADLLRDRDLSRLRQAQDAKARTEHLLRALDTVPASAGLTPAASAQVVERFGLWTANRRVTLNQRHAREMAAWLGARDDAKQAFGRSEVLDRLTHRK